MLVEMSGGKCCFVQTVAVNRVVHTPPSVTSRLSSCVREDGRRRPGSPFLSGSSRYRRQAGVLHSSTTATRAAPTTSSRSGVGGVATNRGTVITRRRTAAGDIRLLQIDLLNSLQAAGKTGTLNDVSKLMAQANKQAVVPLNLKIYNAAITAFGRRNSWARAVGLLTEIRRKGLQPDIITYTACITACGRQGKHEKVVELLKEMKEQAKIEPDLICYRQAIASLGKAGQADMALQIISEMNDRGMEADQQCYMSALEACGRAGKAAEAVDMIEQMEGHANAAALTTDLASYSYAISACNRAGQPQRAVALLRQMERRGIQVDAAVYNMCISGFAKQGQAFLAVKLFEEMSEKGVEPDTRSYSSTLEAFAKIPDQSGKALELLRLMEANNLKVDAFSYNCVITAMGNEKDSKVNEIVGLLAEMEAKGVMPNSHCFASAISGCLRAGAAGLEPALQLLASMESKGVALNTHVYLAAINGCAQVGQTDKALQLLREMEQEKGIKPDVFCYSAAMNACAKQAIDGAASAITLLDEMEEKKIAPNDVCFNSALNACAKSADADAAVSLLHRMAAQGCKPNVISFTAAVNACGRSGQLDRAFRLCSAMKAQGVMPNVITYNALLAACGTGSRSSSIGGQPLGELQQEAASCEDRVRRAMEVLDEMRRQSKEGGGAAAGGGGGGGGGVKPNSITYRVAVDVMENMQQYKKADDLYAEALANGMLNHWKERSSIMDLTKYTTATSKTALRHVLFVEKIHERVKNLRIITGYGKENEDGVRVLKPVVRAYLTELQSAVGLGGGGGGDDNGAGRAELGSTDFVGTVLDVPDNPGMLRLYFGTSSPHTATSTSTSTTSSLSADVRSSASGN